MNRYALLVMPRNIVIRVLLSLPFLAGTGSARSGQVLQIINPNQGSRVLSDLIVFGDSAQKQVILKPNDASDDITMPANGIRVFDANFDVRSYIVSVTSNGNEYESSLLNVSLLEPRKLSAFQNASTGQPLFLSLDQALTAYDPPQEGMVLNFTNGINPNLPGYFVGTSIDFDTGQVLGPFTGTARSLGETFRITVVPEPASWCMLSIGLCGLVLTRRRIRNRS